MMVSNRFRAEHRGPVSTWSKNMRDQFADALKEALKAKDARRTSTVRLIQAAIKDRDIANRGQR